MSQSPLEWIKDFHQCLAVTQCRLAGRSVSLTEGYDALEVQFKAARSREASVWWVGNGGSSGLCSHLSQDLLNKLKLRSQVLTDAALITCIANDYGYPSVYEKPLRLLSRPGDLLIAISSSGQSENILACARLAEEKNMSLVTLSAFKPDNPLWQFPADISFYVPTQLYGQAEVGHEALLHAAIETIWLKETEQAVAS